MNNEFYVKRMLISGNGNLYIDKGKGLRKQECKHYTLGTPCGEYCPDFFIINHENLGIVTIRLCNSSYWTEIKHFNDLRKDGDEEF